MMSIPIFDGENVATNFTNFHKLGHKLAFVPSSRTEFVL
jgi:hypothetical protein